MIFGRLLSRFFRGTGKGNAVDGRRKSSRVAEHPTHLGRRKSSL
jgi:hypothetical protein